MAWRMIALSIALTACSDRSSRSDQVEEAPPTSRRAAAEPPGGPLPQIIAPPISPPDIQGIVTATDSSSIRIEENPSEGSGSPKAIVQLTDRTIVLFRSGQTTEPAELTVGHNVSVWFSGSELESFPVQATADTITIEPSGSI